MGDITPFSHVKGLDNKGDFHERYLTLIRYFHAEKMSVQR